MIMRLLAFSVILLSIFCQVHSKGKLIKLDEDTWSEMLKGEWMVEFYAPWCPACRSMQSIWESFADWGDDLGIQVAQVDVTTNPGLSGRFMVTALPTLYHVKDGIFRQYKGSRSNDDLISLIEEKKWQVIEPLATWKSPQSIPMTLVSHFFKLSMVLRGIHTQFVDNYGIPYWGSYGIFAMITIVCGAILGLILVCIMDCIYPPKPFELPSKKKTPPPSDSEEEKSSEEKKEDSPKKEDKVKKRKPKKEQ